MSKMMIGKTTCKVSLQNHNWVISFAHHGEKVCLYICAENALPESQVVVIGRWKAEAFLEGERKQDFCNYLKGL